ncbi:hypothetical protein D3C76_1216210 [compost metagenome]
MKKRSEPVQTWPEFRKAEKVAAFTAISKSASSMTMNGSELPSSSSSGFMRSVAPCMIF